jgi:Rrf2 family transcriptional regulator, nitric oxide-sensitive transcriptional repressor
MSQQRFEPHGSWSILSRTGEYAVRAIAYIAGSDGSNVTAAEIAEAIGVPSKYLSKVMHALVHAGLLDGTPGPRGGFRLARPADRITLLEVLTTFEIGRARGCMLGRSECHHGGCPVGFRCREISAALDEFLRTTCVDRLVPRPALPPKRGGRRISVPPESGQVAPRAPDE